MRAILLTLRKSKYLSLLLLVGLVLFTASPARAVNLFVDFSDPTGDGTSLTDLTGMDLSFDNATGQYTVVMTATASKPFVGHFLLNVNLFDHNRDSSPPSNTGFFEAHHEDTLASSVTVMTWTGNNTVHKNWQPGDVVAINELAFGVPACYAGSPVNMTAFHTEVLDLPSSTSPQEDQVYGGTTATIRSVPEPATMLLLGFGLVGLASIRRKKQ
jgi:hypothetical protein